MDAQHSCANAVLGLTSWPFSHRKAANYEHGYLGENCLNAKTQNHVGIH